MANPRPITVQPEEPHFHQKNAIKSGVRGGLAGGAAGLFIAAVQNSLAKRNVGSWAVFSKHGNTIATYAVMGTTFKFTTDAAANLREKDDTLNTTIGAFVAGATLGLRAGRIPRILGFGALFSVVFTAFEYTGGSLRGGQNRANDLDEYERKEFMRLNRRRPMEETVAELGEGRGIRPPGYEERRRERLKEKFGVEINPVKATAD
ncbi:hypothetical protein DL764_009229 [Monosporascus ibericus]|uniref:NADH-ubiquinone oxidoreductase 213 kDa subunit n=1 Tax=Monosporascus ibericus TaxID=155417 RepID=A0A4Q4SYF6_9PEZI|nr:hypothetical protein DL764_009229 [Monosporascus ibericus]